MVTIERIQRGLSRYIEEQVLPHMQGKDKWLVAGGATMYLQKLPAIVKAAANKEAVKALGVVADDGAVDVEFIINSIKPVARTTPAVFQMPLSTSTITLREEDLDTILKYITGG